MAGSGSGPAGRRRWSGGWQAGPSRREAAQRSLLARSRGLGGRRAWTSLAAAAAGAADGAAAGAAAAAAAGAAAAEAAAAAAGAAAGAEAEAGSGAWGRQGPGPWGRGSG